CRTFNQNISNWNTSKVESMACMFYDCTSFNQPLGDWDVSEVKYMSFMFSDCRNFNQDISNWDINNVNDTDMFENCPIDNLNMPSQEQSSVKRQRL
ncbi:BspA family leucine-rich repeat surface protein, partial [Campylobacter jejuni]|nr:BspA family leucine-rich repeat surface protein [Campylobacter jejuni]EGA8646532.1 BspA family leucine-rich repeat surface protein [Campylobacter jejuni]